MRPTLLTLLIVSGLAGRASGDPTDWREVSSAASPAAAASLFATETLFAPAANDASSKDAADPIFAVYAENDVRYFNPGNPSDRHYTNGVKFVIAWHDRLADRAARAIPFAQDWTDLRSAAGLTLGQLIFTPEDFRRRSPDPEDHPYVGWCFGGLILQRASPAKGVMDHFELDFGVVGESSLARETQSEFHDLIGEARFHGWGRQLRDEPAFNLIWERRWKQPHGPARQDALTDGDEGDLRLDLLPHVGLTAGTVNVEARVGATARLGWGLPDDFAGGTIRHASDFTGQPSPLGLYVFGRVEGRAVAWNTLLQGNMYHHSPSVTPEPLVGEAAAGVALEFGRHVRLAWTQTYLTQEFKEQRTHDSYGTVMLMVRFDLP